MWFRSLTHLAVQTAAAFGLLAFGLHSLDIAHYSPENDLNLWTFVKYFVWLALDIIPVLEISETFGLEQPLTPVNVVAGIPVVLFRMVFVVGFVGAVAAWWGRKSPGSRT
jgi:hypothetical protein